MKRRTLHCVAFAAILFYAALIAPERASSQAEIEAMNRAASAKVTASSFRRARLSEIPRASEFPQVNLDDPNSWPNLKPIYAADQSPITQWATDGNQDEYLQYDFANRLARSARLSRVGILWGRDFASSFHLESSNDGEIWTTIARGNIEKRGLSELRFPGEVNCRYLRLWCEKSGTGKGFAVVGLDVWGTPAPSPGPVGKVSASSGAGGIKVEWSAGGAGTYDYLVYGSETPGFKPGRQSLIAETDARSWVDRRPGNGARYYKVRARGFDGGMSAPSSEASAAAPGSPSYAFPIRGVVEGFYNDPWPHRERIKMVRFLAGAGYNRYIYAPKSDPFHRQWWRKPYPPEEMENFRELADACRAGGLRLNFGVSPGLDYNYSDPGDLEKLKEKLGAMLEMGVTSFTLCLDDIPDYRSAGAVTARRQAELANTVYAWLTERSPGAEMFFVPTIYSRSLEYWTRKRANYAAYLTGLSAIHPEVGIMWTGPGKIFSDSITADSARGLMGAWNRKVIIWDNNPVNDVTLRYNLIMAPYEGRSRDLPQAVQGIFLNPMYLPNSSKITLYTAGQYMRDPAGYDPGRAFEEAVNLVGGEGRDVLAPLARAQAYHPLFPGQDVGHIELARALDAFWKAGTGEERAGAEKILRGLFASYSALPGRLYGSLPDFELARELEGPANKLALYGAAGGLALDYMAEADEAARAELARKIAACRAEAKKDPWRVADGSQDGLYVPPGASQGRHDNVMESFLDKAVR